MLTKLNRTERVGYMYSYSAQSRTESEHSSEIGDRRRELGALLDFSVSQNCPFPHSFGACTLTLRQYCSEFFTSLHRQYHEIQHPRPQRSQSAATPTQTATATTRRRRNNQHLVFGHVHEFNSSWRAPRLRHGGSARNAGTSFHHDIFLLPRDGVLPHGRSKCHSKSKVQHRRIRSCISTSKRRFHTEAKESNAIVQLADFAYKFEQFIGCQQARLITGGRRRRAELLWFALGAYDVDYFGHFGDQYNGTAVCAFVQSSHRRGFSHHNSSGSFVHASSSMD